MQSSSTTANARAFVRSLNVLLKYCNFYGLEHPRSPGQFDAAWSELRSAVRSAGDLGLLVGVSGAHLLLDGVPLDLSPAELDFAELLAAARVGSIRFMSSVSRAEFRQLIKAFIDASAPAGTLAARVESQFGYHTKSRIHTSESLFIQEGVGFYEGGSTTALESQIAEGGAAESKRPRSRNGADKTSRVNGKAATQTSPQQSRRSQRARNGRRSNLSAFALASEMVDQAEFADVQAFESILHFESQSIAIDQRPRESTVTDSSSGYDFKQASKQLQSALRKIGDEMAAEADAAPSRRD